MIDNQSTSEPESVLNSLHKYVHFCFNNLRGILTICDEEIKSRAEGRPSDFYMHQLLFIELEPMIDKIANIKMGALLHNTLQNEVRKSLLSFQRDKHDEVYYVLIKDVLTYLNKCIAAVEKYTANEEIYNNFIKVCSCQMTEEDVNVALSALSKLAPGHTSGNLLHSAMSLRNAIKSVIPPSDLHKVIPLDELPPAPTSTDQEPEPTEPGVKLQWNGDKTDLAELVWALTKSNQIIDPSTNKPVVISELTRQLEILFGIEKLDVDGLVSKRIRNTYKSADGKTFMDTLQRLMKERIATTLKK